MPLIVGISRIYRGVHYLTGVAAGIVLGATCVVAVYVLGGAVSDTTARINKDQN